MAKDLLVDGGLRHSLAVNVQSAATAVGVSLLDGSVNPFPVLTLLIPPQSPLPEQPLVGAPSVVPVNIIYLYMAITYTKGAWTYPAVMECLILIRSMIRGIFKCCSMKRFSRRHW